VQKSLQENEDLIRMFREITLINCDVPMNVSMHDFAVTPQPLDKLLSFCDRVNFGSGVRHRIEKYRNNSD
jgi:hypothetical protein